MTKIIDFHAGHGGKDPGAMGNKLLEKDVTLNLCKRIKTKGEHYYDCEIYLGRNTDVFIPLGEHDDLAAKAKADYFVSMHINSSDNTTAHGGETFIHLNASLSNEKTASIIHKHIADYNKKWGITDRGMKRANFQVLRETVRRSMPSQLIEICFISNSKEAILLKSEEYLNGLAKAIVDGLAEALFLEKRKV